jgi:hypothetical protein
VGKALLGSWPQQVAAWGPQAIAAYVNELAARGLTPDETLVAIRTWPTPTDPTRDFPPSASALAAHARRDPDRPSFEEMWAQVRLCLAARSPVRKARWEPGERAELDELAALERAAKPDIKPLVEAFIRHQGGPSRLRALDLDDPGNEHREARRHDLRGAWEEFCSKADERGVAALIGGVRRGEIGRVDPLPAITGGSQVESSNEERTQ